MKKACSSACTAFPPYSLWRPAVRQRKFRRQFGPTVRKPFFGGKRYADTRELCLDSKAAPFRWAAPESEAWRSDDETQHTVTVSGFYMSKYELTQKEYEEVMGSNRAISKESICRWRMSPGSTQWPHCNARSERDGLTPVYTIDGQTVSWDRSANGYRLPTEVEWEYACRAGTDTPFLYGKLAERRGRKLLRPLPLRNRRPLFFAGQSGGKARRISAKPRFR